MSQKKSRESHRRRVTRYRISSLCHCHCRVYEVLRTIKSAGVTPPPPPPPPPPRLNSVIYLPTPICMILIDASSRNNTPKHEAPLCARDWGINSNYFIMGPEGKGGGEGGGVRTPRTPSLDPPLACSNRTHVPGEAILWGPHTRSASLYCP